MTKQELNNKQNSDNSKRAISIALATSILSIGLSIYLAFFPPIKPEEIDYNKIAIIYERIIDDQNNKLILSSTENSSNIQTSIKSVEEGIDFCNDKLLDEYEKININFKALKIAYEHMILKDNTSKSNRQN